MVIDLTYNLTHSKGEEEVGLMLRMNVHEVKAHLSETLTKVAKGETVIICKRNIPIAELRPIEEKKERKPRPIGLTKERYPDFVLTDDFLEPLPDDIIAAFYGEET